MALVTGGGRGIGRAHALTLSSRGCRVVIADAGLDITGTTGSGDTASQVASEIAAAGGSAVAYRGNVVSDAQAIVDHAVSSYGRLDILINNAGPVGSFRLFEETPAEAWQAVVDAHYRGTVAMCRAAWPQLAKSSAGRIVNTASSAMFGSAHQTDYGSAKAAIFGFSRSLAIEGRERGIAVNCILPAGFTRMMGTIPDATFRAETERLLGPEHIAAFVAWLVHQETTVTGETFNIAGGRAARVLLAEGAAVKIGESTPEMWRQEGGRLFNDAPLSPLTTMTESFADALCDIEPSIAPYVKSYLSAGLSLRTEKEKGV